jgi:phthalate 4,5-dioxygenase oxygenase subunit
MLAQSDNELLTRVGPGTPMGTLFRRFWQPVSLSSRITGPDGQPVRLRILGENLIAFRDTNGAVGVLQALCPHRRTQLFWGRNEEGGLRCAYHGWKFDVTGQCVDMPTEPPESNYKDRLRTIGYPVVERGGFVWVYMGPRDKQPGFPEYEWLDLPESQRMVFTGLQESNYLQALEGDVDTAHVSYLHRYLDPETAPKPAVFNQGYRHFVGQDVSPRLSVKRTDYGFLYGGRRTLSDGTYYWRLTPWMAPAATYLPTTGDLGQALIRVPIDDNYTLSAGLIWSRTGPLPDGPDTTRRNRPVDPGPTRLTGGHVIDLPRGATNLDNDYLIDRDAEKDKFVGVQGGTNAEDRAVTESMGELDRSQEHLGVSDIAVVALRRGLLAMLRDLDEGKEPAAAQRPELFRVRGRDILSEHGDYEQLLEAHADDLLLGPSATPTH